jgi:hypothetical protein
VTVQQASAALEVLWLWVACAAVRLDTPLLLTTCPAALNAATTHSCAAAAAAAAAAATAVACT